MNTFTLEIFDDEGSECTFYTIRQEDETYTETEKFFSQYDDRTNQYYEAAEKLLNFIIYVIGEDHGAINAFFDRNKNYAQALPPRMKSSYPEILNFGPGFPLRLYCYRISESLVVLFNGGVKDHRTDQESPDISMKFIEAQQFALKIQKAFDEGMIIIHENRTLKTFDDNSEIIIY